MHRAFTNARFKRLGLSPMAKLVNAQSAEPPWYGPVCPVVCEPGGSDREHDAVATVLIIGASRGIGLETVKAALEAGHSVRALARSARRISVDHPKLEKMAGDAARTRSKRAV
jgi:short chain dehydrogenase